MSPGRASPPWPPSVPHKRIILGAVPRSMPPQASRTGHRPAFAPIPEPVSPPMQN